MEKAQEEENRWSEGKVRICKHNPSLEKCEDIKDGKPRVRRVEEDDLEQTAISEVDLDNDVVDGRQDKFDLQDHI